MMPSWLVCTKWPCVQTADGIFSKFVTSNCSTGSDFITGCTVAQGTFNANVSGTECFPAAWSHELWKPLLNSNNATSKRYSPCTRKWRQARGSISNDMFCHEEAGRSLYMNNMYIMMRNEYCSLVGPLQSDSALKSRPNCRQKSWNYM
jgi:hypothetical protein